MQWLQDQRYRTSATGQRIDDEQQRPGKRPGRCIGARVALCQAYLDAEADPAHVTLKELRTDVSDKPGHPPCFCLNRGSLAFLNANIVYHFSIEGYQRDHMCVVVHFHAPVSGVLVIRYCWPGACKVPLANRSATYEARLSVF